MAMPPASATPSGPAPHPHAHSEAHPPRTQQEQPPGSLEPDLFAYDAENDAASVSPQLSAAHFRRAVHRVHDVLYGGRGRDRTEIDRVVREHYDTGAAFENPLTLARGKSAIADMFALLAFVPGSMWSEMGEVTHSHSSFDGSRLVVFSHTLHLSLLSFLERENAPPCGAGAGAGGHAGGGGGGGGCTPATPSRRRSYSFFSLPGTPFPVTPSAQYGDDGKSEAGEYSPGIFSKTYAAVTTRDRWPAASLLSALSPRSIASSLSTLHLKVHTRLLFNEEGRIILHEDTWGLKEIVEGVFPLGAHLYAVNRQALGWAASLASRILLPKPLEDPTPNSSGGDGGGNAAQVAAKKPLDPLWKKDDGEALFSTEENLARYHHALMMSTAPHRPLLTPFPGYGPPTTDESPLGNALGVDVGRRAQPTTMEEEDS
ncbi:hypothetical protein JCM8202v2_000656 [Rhodotorula sphaerocarpa]